MEQNWVKRSTTLLIYIGLTIGIILACGAVETPPEPPPPAQPIAPAAAPPAATALPVQKAEAKKAAQLNLLLGQNLLLKIPLRLILKQINKLERGRLPKEKPQ